MWNVMIFFKLRLVIQATPFVNRYKFRCPRGFFCPEGTGYRADLESGAK